MLKFLIASACLLSTPLLANSHPAPGQWSATGEYLYLKPSIDDTYFVIKTRTPTEGVILNGTEHNNKFNFNSGYRLGLAYGLCECDWDYAWTYTHLDSDHNKRVRGEFLTASVGIEDYSYYLSDYTGSARSKLHSRYDRFDSLFSSRIYECCGADLRVVLGLEYAVIKTDQKIRYDVDGTTCEGDEFCVSSARVKRYSKTWGTGPEFGFDFNYDLCQLSSCLPGGFSLNFVSTGSLLLAESRSHLTVAYDTTEGDFFYKVRQEKTTRIIPAFHAKLGLNYNFCMYNREAVIGLGYEFNTYLRSLQRTNNSSYYGSLTGHQYNDFDLQGFFASLSVRF